MLLSDFGEQHFFCHCLSDFLQPYRSGSVNTGVKQHPIKALRMKKFILCVAVIATLSMSSLVFAQRPGGDGEPGQRGQRGQRGQQGEGGQRGGGGQRGQRPVSPLMTALDVDKDGKLSAEEIAGAAETLKSLDKNEDGVIDASEMTPARGQGGGQGGQGGGRGGDPAERVDRMMELDADGNGEISKEEGGDRMSRFFDIMDSDGNGSLTREEIETAMKNREGGGGRQSRGGGAGGRQGGTNGKPERPAFED